MVRLVLACARKRVMLSRTGPFVLCAGTVDVWSETMVTISIDAVFLAVVVATNSADCAMICCDEGSVDSLVFSFAAG
jgi:hypothetical protein